MIGHVDSILYQCIPPKFIKRIFRQYNCLLDEKIYSGKAPRAPLLSSNYDSSFIAGLLQLRYIYSMPVERIVIYFAGHGFEMGKSTAHGQIKKPAWMMERMDMALNKTILADDYLSMDESYYTILKRKTARVKVCAKGISGPSWAIPSDWSGTFMKTAPFTRSVDQLYRGKTNTLPMY